MTKINAEKLVKKPFSVWTEEEKIFFLHDLLDHHNRPIPGYVETMLDKVIYSPDELKLQQLSEE